MHIHVELIYCEYMNVLGLFFHLCTKVDSSINANYFTCSSRIWGVENATCVPEPYTGSVCRAELLAWQGCATGQAQPQDTTVSVTGNQAELEQGVMEILQSIG